jgi:hypothetical protein
VPLVPLGFVRAGLTLVGSLVYDHPVDFARAMELVRAGQGRPSGLVARAHQLEDPPDVQAGLAAGAAGKALLDVAGIRPLSLT